MAELEYLPTHYVDEVCPAMRAHPSDWLIVADAHINLVACPEEDDEADRPGQVLFHGDVESFDRCEDLGTVTMTVWAKAGRVKSYRPIPSAIGSANHFVIDGDCDTGLDDLDNCIEAWADNERLDGEREIEVSMWRWTTDKWVLTTDATGARFAIFQRIDPS